MAIEILKEFKDVWAARITHPLSGTILVSWAAYNYRAILVVLSSQPYRDKFEYLDNVLYGSPKAIFLSFAVPIAFTAFYIYLYPFIAKPVFEWNIKRSNLLSNSVIKLSGKKYITEEDANKKDAAIREMSHQLEIAQADAVQKKDEYLVSEAEAKAQISQIAYSLKFERARSMPIIDDDELGRERLANVLCARPHKASGIGDLLFTKGGAVRETSKFNRWEISSNNILRLFLDATETHQLQFIPRSMAWEVTSDDKTLVIFLSPPDDSIVGGMEMDDVGSEAEKRATRRRPR
ncbi:hypothetical protein ACODUO_02885 [Stenotrophomonas maltophilia]